MDWKFSDWTIAGYMNWSFLLRCHLYLCSGVVQGSCIGPLLFLIYINDVSEEFPDSCICKLYADDVKLYSVMKTVNDYKTLQKSLHMLDNWSHVWQLPISYKKCSFMIISNLKNEQDLSLSLHLGNNAISQQETTKDLGIHTDSSLKFSSHISQLVAKAHARASVIHKCFLSKDRITLVKA